MLSKLRKVGPGAMVAAAFIGPGTVTTATLAGARFGYTLLWAVAFSILATFILQEMAARLGLIGDMSMGAAIRRKVPTGLPRVLAVSLVVGAILIGNAAYEAGNITGAVLGLPVINLPSTSINGWVLMIGLLSFVLLYSGRYKWIERALVGLVMTMGVVFLIAAFFTQPDWRAIAKGLFLPGIPKGGLMMVMGLIGTTVVPYNLFLHASAVRQKWSSPDDLSTARMDAFISILAGGCITGAILIASAAVLSGTGEVMGAADLAGQLQPFLGKYAEAVLGTGFLAAGLSSSITAPLAAAFAAKGILGWTGDMRSRAFRTVWIIVLSVGVLFASLQFKPLEVILLAQVANGILLPVIVIFLLWVMNDRNIMGQWKNDFRSNLLGMLVVVVTTILGAKSLASVFGII